MRTIVEAGQAYSQPVESGKPVLKLERGHVNIAALHPLGAHSLQPCWQQDANIVTRLCNVAVLCATGISDDEMGNVRGQIELDGRAHLCANGAEFRLH